MIILLVGVTGSGKTTVGRLLGQDLGWEFVDGDDFHPDNNIAKMSQGIPLTDEDRQSWLRALKDLFIEISGKGKSAVVACSALKDSYRMILLEGQQDIRLVYLKGDLELIQSRLADRQGHFAGASLLPSQFETLEEPQNALKILITQTPEQIATAIKKEFLIF